METIGYAMKKIITYSAGGKEPPGSGGSSRARYRFRIARYGGFNSRIALTSGIAISPPLRTRYSGRVGSLSWDHPPCFCENHSTVGRRTNWIGWWTRWTTNAVATPSFALNG
jgi:hypothetical protein